MEEKGDTFAIIGLANHKKALVSGHRVWINDKPKYGGWKSLYMSYFKNLRVSYCKLHFKKAEYVI